MELLKSATKEVTKQWGFGSYLLIKVSKTDTGLPDSDCDQLQDHGLQSLNSQLKSY